MGRFVDIQRYGIDLIVVEIAPCQQASDQIADIDTRWQLLDVVVDEVERHAVCQKALIAG